MEYKPGFRKFVQKKKKKKQGYSVVGCIGEMGQKKLC
jgi:hypothetical protein